jgi:GBP family porin
MFKKLLPVVGALAFASAAHAQTAITLYGIADGSLRFDHTAIGTLKSLASGGESASRWGIRGTEDLGGGLKAIFNFEQDIDISDSSVSQGAVTPTTPTSPVNGVAGSSRLFGRRSIVGLNSSTWGEIRVGREFTPMYQVWSAADAFGNGDVGRANNIAVGSTTRFDNSVTYETVSYAGFVGKAMFRFGESTTNNQVAGSATKGGGAADSFSITYAKGPIYAGVGYIYIKSPVDTGPLSNPVRSETAAVSYDFGFLKLNGLYFHTKNLTTSKVQSYEMSIAVPVYAWTFQIAAGRIDNKFDSNGSALHLNDSNYAAIGAAYALSKRTDFYMAYSKMTNTGAATALIGDNSNNGLYTAANVPAGFNPWSAQFGIRFLF